MNTLRGWIATTFLLTAILISPTSADAGIIVGNLSGTTENPPCYDQTVKVAWSTIAANLTGIIVGNFTGIIVGNSADSPVQNCGIIVGN